MSLVPTQKMTLEEFRAALHGPWDFVKREVKENNISAIELAKGAGLGRSTVRNYTNGYRKHPRVEQLEKMLRFVLARRGESLPKKTRKK